MILFGVLTTMLGVAIVLVIVAVPIGAILGYLVPAIDGLLIVLGLLLLAGRNPFERLPGMNAPVVGNPFARAYIYGLLLGPLALPCAGAFALSLIAVLGRAWRMRWRRSACSSSTGSGSGCPLVLLSLLAGARQQQIVRYVTRHHRAIEVVGGVLLIGVGIGDVIVNLESLRLSFGI